MQQVIKEIFESDDFIGKDENFLSEKDLQFNLARMLRNKFECVLLEYPIVNKVDNKNKYQYVDIYCKKSEESREEYFIELKYKTKKQDVIRFGIKDLILQDHSAYYDNRFLIYKDISRLEKIVSKNAKGYLLFLTNNNNYQKESNRNFPLNNKIVKNEYEHRNDPITIKNNYTLEWKDFAEHKGFKYLLVEIQNKEEIAK